MLLHGQIANQSQSCFKAEDRTVPSSIRRDQTWAIPLRPGGGAAARSGSAFPHLKADSLLSAQSSRQANVRLLTRRRGADARKSTHVSRERALTLQLMNVCYRGLGSRPQRRGWEQDGRIGESGTALEPGGTTFMGEERRRRELGLGPSGDGLGTQ
jgi:hypothetical protein